MGKIIAGIPSNRPELCKKAVEAWRATGQFHEIWVMWDGQKDLAYQVALAMELEGSGNTRIFVQDPNLSCIPTGSGCCRSRLVLEAWKDPDVEWIVHLDDDVMPSRGNWQHELRTPRHWTARWQSVSLDFGFPTRGLPYSTAREERLPKLVHGIWCGIPDVDAINQLAWPGDPRPAFDPKSICMTYARYFTMSSMAVAIHRDLFPASYFLWMGKDLPLNKFGDIWCGVILKRICDHFGWLVTSGAPVVYHERASNVWENLRQECKCIEENEHFWEWVDAVDLSLCATVSQCYRRIAEGMYMPPEPRFKELREKMLSWISEFD